LTEGWKFIKWLCRAVLELERGEIDSGTFMHEFAEKWMDREVKFPKWKKKDLRKDFSGENRD